MKFRISKKNQSKINQSDFPFFCILHLYSVMSFKTLCFSFTLFLWACKPNPTQEQNAASHSPAISNSSPDSATRSADSAVSSSIPKALAPKTHYFEIPVIKEIPEGEDEVDFNSYEVNAVQATEGHDGGNHYQAATNDNPEANYLPETTEPVFDEVEQKPEFLPKGGLDAYIKEHLVYPTEALEEEIEGSTLISFVVERNGKISFVQVLRSSGNADLDYAAIKLIKSMPAWAPGRQQGAAVRTRVILPITFKLQ